jgi:hypothetical protein
LDGERVSDGRLPFHDAERQQLEKAGLLQGPAFSASLAVFRRDGAVVRSIPDVEHNSAIDGAGLAQGQSAVNRLLTG